MIFEKLELETDEKILAVIRRHWFFLVKQCFFILVLIILPVVGFAFSKLFAPQFATELTSSYMPHMLFLYAFWLLLNWMMLAMIWTDHYLDIWTITNKRIININQISLFRRQVGSFRLEKLQDLSVEINGIVATLLDYGTIHAETASGKNEEFKASYLPKPQQIKSLILQASDKQMAPTSVV